MHTKTTLLACVGVVLLAVVSPGSARASGAPCSGNTTGDTLDCSGACTKNSKVGVQMYSNDANSEHGFANTSCSTATAACSFTSPAGLCSAESSQAAGSNSTWGCHFEAHDDDWWGQDNGFSYNCYAYGGDRGGGGGGGGGGGIDQSKYKSSMDRYGTMPQTISSYSSFSAPTCSGASAENANALLVKLCAILADPAQAPKVVVSYADSQTIVYAEGGAAAGLSCNGDTCRIVVPTCVSLVDGLACDVSPLGMT